MEIKNSEDLKIAIRELEQKELRQKEQLTTNFHAFKETLTPLHLLKSTFNKVKETPGITSTILKASLGLGVGILSKKLFFGKSPGILRKVIGSAVQMGLAGLVAKKTDAIKHNSGQLIKRIFRSKKLSTVK